MGAVSFTQGLKLVGDKASAVAGAAAAIAGMSFDDNTVAFVNTHTACNSGGASPHFQGNALDSTPTGGAAATPYVVSHLCTLTPAQFNTFTVKRLALHNSAAPTDSSTTLAFGLDGMSLLKGSGFGITPTFKISYS